MYEFKTRYQMHSLTFHTAPECYVRPEEFIPERWYSQPELVKKNVFAAFGIGKPF